MKPEDISNALSEISEEYIDSANKRRKNKRYLIYVLRNRRYRVIKIHCM